MEKTWESFALFCRSLQAETGMGRASLRRKWSNLRQLANRVLGDLSAEEVASLLGKQPIELDPEHNDLKAVVSYAVGKGLLSAVDVRSALERDAKESPLHFLAELSGKAFGESVAPKICQFWLCVSGDQWVKQPASAYYDLLWVPAETQKRVRIEVKASSEAPAFRFQQIRDPRMSGGNTWDYDVLLCLGVTAASVEFWWIPAADIIALIESGVFTNQHGGAKVDSHTYWVTTDAVVRRRLLAYSTAADSLRAHALTIAA